jgi:predicted dinucleotide-utilizing enzyme
MNLNPLWEQRDENGAIDYFRAVSTGPITPLVLSVTTVKDVANLGLTFKKTVFSESEIEGFVSNFTKSIQLAEVST